MKNAISAHQSPKPRCGNDRDEEARPGWYANPPKHRYTPYASLRDPGVIDGGGQIDKRPAWRCPDCGGELQDVLSSCCYRCGSVEPAEYR